MRAPPFGPTLLILLLLHSLAENGRPFVPNIPGQLGNLVWGGLQEVAVSQSFPTMTSEALMTA